MQRTKQPQRCDGRTVTVGPGLLDAQLSTTTGLAVQLAFSVEHRFRLELHGDGPLAGAHGRLTSEFVVAEDGTVAEHDVVVLLNPDDPGGRRQ